MFRFLLYAILAAVFLSACGMTRPAPPADPNQALLNIIQQRTLERSVLNWTGERPAVMPMNYIPYQSSPAPAPEQYEFKSKCAPRKMDVSKIPCDVLLNSWNERCYNLDVSEDEGSGFAIK